VELTLPGIRLRQEGRVTRWEPPYSLAVAQWSHRHQHRGFSPPLAGFSHQQRLSVQPVEGWPQATVLQSTIVGSLVPWFVEAAFRPVIRRYMLSHLAALKCAIESTDKSGRPQRDPRGRLAEMPAVGAG